MANDEHTRKKETRQASTIIAVCSVVGLTVCFWLASSKEASVPIFLYAIFGGGILGTDNILSLIKAVFRIGSSDDR